jgi:drug/metabolite transporter (DMT)-like permease
VLTRLQVSGTTLYGLGVLLFAVNDALLKMLSQKYASYDIIFFRSFFGVLLIFGVQVLRGQLASLKTDRAWVMTLRSLFGFLSIYFSIKSLVGLDLASYNIYYHMAPLLIAALSILFLKEKPTKGILIALLVGFSGVIISFRGGLGPFDIYKGYVILGALFWALSLLLIKFLSAKATTEAILFYTALFNMAVAVPFVKNYNISFIEWSYFLIPTVVHSLAFLFIIEGIKRSSLVSVAPLEYTGVVWTLILGYIFWHELPDVWMFIGGVLIILASFKALRKNH